MLSALEIQLAKELGMLKESTSKAAQPLTSTIADTGGGLAQELATEFINLTVNESVLLSTIARELRRAPSGELSKIDVTTNVARQGTENTAGTETRRPTFTKLTYNAKKVETLFDITGEFQTGNIEFGGGEQTVREAMMNAVMNDWETLAIEGDEANGGSTDFDNLVKTNDGFNTLATLANGAHIKDASDTRVSRELIKQGLAQLPTKYRRDPSRLRLFMSQNVALDLADEGAARSTDLGDALYNTGAGRDEFPVGPFGIRVVVVPLMPEDLATGGTNSTASVMWLTDPANLIAIMQRQLTVESERKPREDRTEVTVRTATDYLIRDTNGFVKFTNILTDFDAGRFGA